MTGNDGSHRLEPERSRSAADDTVRITDSTDARKEELDRTGQNDPSVRYDRPAAAVPVHEQRVLPARTSIAAVFALVFGLSALLAALTVILAPVALVLAVIGIILGIIGMKMGRRVGITGRGVAIGALITAVLALILSATIVAGVTTVLNNQNAVDRLDKQVQKLRDNLPAKVKIPTQ